MEWAQTFVYVTTALFMLAGVILRFRAIRRGKDSSSKD